MQITKLLIILVSLCFGLIACNSGGNCSSSCSSPAPIPPITNLVSLDSSNGGVADGATDVSLTPTIAIKFSLVMNPSTVNNSTIYLSTSPTLTSFAATLHLKGMLGSVAISNINADQTYQIFTFNPLVALSQNTKYYVIITSGAKSASGNSITGQFSFTTGTIASPTVSLTTPGNGATGVTANPNLQFRFSTTVLNVNTSTVTLQKNCNGQAIAVSTIIAGDDNTFTFSPSTLLEQQTNYCVAFSSGITNTYGNALIPVSYTFTTGDFSNPTVSMLIPGNNATGVSVNPSIQFKFSETVVSVNPTNVVLHAGSPDGAVVSIGGIIAGDNNTYTFSPESTLNQQTIYYLVFKNGIADSAGNPLTEVISNFTTGDFSNPTVSMLIPGNNATEVSVNPSIQVKFSESVENVTPSNVVLHQDSESGAVVAITSIVAGENNVYTFDPSIQLNPQTVYYLVLSSGITDTSGNSLIPIIFSFTTGVVGLPISLNPTSLKSGTTDTITFNFYNDKYPYNLLLPNGVTTSTGDNGYTCNQSPCTIPIKIDSSVNSNVYQVVVHDVNGNTYYQSLPIAKVSGLLYIATYTGISACKFDPITGSVAESCTYQTDVGQINTSAVSVNSSGAYAYISGRFSGDANTIKVCQIQQTGTIGKLINCNSVEINGLSSGARGIVTNAEQSKIYIGDLNRKIYVCDISPNNPNPRNCNAFLAPAAVSRLALNFMGNTLLFGDEGHSLYSCTILSDYQIGQCTSNVINTGMSYSSPAFSYDNKLLFVSGENGSLVQTSYNIDSGAIGSTFNSGIINTATIQYRYLTALYFGPTYAVISVALGGGVGMLRCSLAVSGVIDTCAPWQQLGNIVNVDGMTVFD